MLDVRIMTVFLKSILRPCELEGKGRMSTSIKTGRRESPYSVSAPSSSTCSKMFATSGAAFSNSSNKTTE